MRISYGGGSSGFRSRRSAVAAAALTASRTRRRRPARRSRSASCPTARARSARSTRRTQAGVFAAFSEYAGAKPKDPNDPRKGITGGTIAGHPIKLVGVGCGSDYADLAINETRRLMEKNKADIMIGPLSGDESVAVANYAKQHPTKTFVNGTAGAQDTTLKVRAPNFFRLNGDGAQWNAGLGDLAYNELGWKTAAVVADNYSFGWTSAAGFIAEFCAVGGKVTQRVLPPLNTTDYSTYAAAARDRRRRHVRRGRRHGPDPVPQGVRAEVRPDQREAAHRQPVLGHAGPVREPLDRVAGAYVGGAGTAGDLNTAAAKNYATSSASGSSSSRPSGAAAPQAASTFTFGYYINAWGLIKGLKAVKGDISGGQKALQKALGKVVLERPVRDASSSTPTGRPSPTR